MHSESVWFEQVDRAFKEHIESIVKLLNSSGEYVSVPVIIRKPDEDFKVEQYPLISIYNLYSTRDKIRYFPDFLVVSRDEDNHKLTLEKSAIPYSLFYQIDFWSTLQSQMNDMTRLWLGYHPDRNFNLKVEDMSGNERSSLVLLYEDLKKSDLMESTSRIFHSFITYRVWVEIDEKITEDKPMVTAVINEVSNSGGVKS